MIKFILFFFSILLCTILFSCTTASDNPVGPKINTPYTSHGKYDLLNIILINDFDTNTEGEELNPQLPESYPSSNSTSSLSLATNEITPGNLNTFLVFKYHTRPNPNGNIYCSFDFIWGETINLYQYGNAVRFYAKGVPNKNGDIESLFVTCLHPNPTTYPGETDADDYDQYRFEVKLSSIWTEYIILFEDFEQAGWGRHQTQEYSFSHNTGLSFGPAADMAGLVGTVYIDNISLAYLIEKK